MQDRPTNRRRPSQKNVYTQGRAVGARHTSKAASQPAASTLMTRRGFLYGAAGVAVAAVGAGIFGATQCSRAQQAEELALSDPALVGTAGATTTASPPISVPEDAVFTTDECTFVEDNESILEKVAQVSLPYGTMLWASDGDVATCLLPCETSTPLATVGLLSLNDGRMTPVLENAVGTNDGFEIYDARANDKGIVWTEADILNGQWRIYTAPLTGANALSGTPSLIAEGGSDWDTPAIVASGDHAFWQTTPKKGTVASSEPGVVMRAPLGGSMDDAVTLLAHTGTLPCDITPTSEGIAVATLERGSKNTYQLLNIDGKGGEVRDQITLPATMKPTYTAYGTSGFSFAFEKIYNTGGGIANLGTYTPADNSADGTWFRFARTPFETPAWSGDWFLVKSTSVVAGVDLANKRYFTIEPENATQGYGEYLASGSTSERFVTYSNVDYTPLNGQRINECNVRIWKPKA